MYTHADKQAVTIPITVDLQPWQIMQVTQALDAERLPYQLAGRTLTVDPVAQPILDMLQVRLPRRGGQGRDFDLLRRQPGHRSPTTDALGFALALGVVWFVVTQSGRVNGIAAAFGLNGDTVRGVAVLIAGLAVTLAISEVIIGAGDSRRWMFVLGMMGLFATVAAWFLLTGMGVL